VIILENQNIQQNVTAEDFTHTIRSSKILSGYTHVLAASSKNGKNYFPRLAALEDSAPLT
jgi:electron transfer flavoprotein alpha subunit